jgi:hypothetical protein
MRPLERYEKYRSAPGFGGQGHQLGKRFRCHHPGAHSQLPQGFQLFGKTLADHRNRERTQAALILAAETYLMFQRLALEGELAIEQEFKRLGCLAPGTQGKAPAAEQRIADEQTHILRHCVPGRLHGIQQFSCRAPGIPASAGDMTDQARLARGAVHRQKFRCSPQKDKYASRHENFLFPV